MSIRVDHLCKRFNSFLAVDDVSFTVEAGQLVALLGPSGSGKSTILRMIAGLETPDSGHVYITGDLATNQSVQKRNVGFVFQHYALFKHMNVYENIAFGLRVRRTPRREVRRRVEELLGMVQLQAFAKRYPQQLSGGQRQRVALARALAPQPKVLLLDEPFGALDAQVRVELREWLRRLHEEVHVTSVFVTHDQSEALEVSDQLVILNKGKIEQVGTPRDVYEKPASPFVMSFIGPVNTLVASENGTPKRMIRPSEFDVRRGNGDNDASTDSASLAGKVESVRYLGATIKLQIVLSDGQHVQVHLSREQSAALDLQRGDWVSLAPKDAHVFREDYSI
ncbi:MAG: sulfate ABC transporter ATP-binding protein [Phycisphaerae bacterium]|nr:sulfate ABC transporter ATP-binding protein [Phycisphaerae bacterium]